MKIKTLFILLFISVTLSAGETKTNKVNFNKETLNAPAKEFSSFVGKWHIDRDNKNNVYAVDGRKWERGLLSKGVVSKAKNLYGERYAEFLDNLKAYKYFPIAEKLRKGQLARILTKF